MLDMIKYDELRGERRSEICLSIKKIISNHNYIDMFVGSCLVKLSKITVKKIILFLYLFL